MCPPYLSLPPAPQTGSAFVLRPSCLGRAASATILASTPMSRRGGLVFGRSMTTMVAGEESQRKRLGSLLLTRRKGLDQANPGYLPCSLACCLTPPWDREILDPWHAWPRQIPRRRGERGVFEAREGRKWMLTSRRSFWRRQGQRCRGAALSRKVRHLQQVQQPHEQGGAF